MWFLDALLFSLMLNTIVFRYADLGSEGVCYCDTRFWRRFYFLGVLMSNKMERIQFSKF